MRGCSSTGMIYPKRYAPGNRKTKPNTAAKIYSTNCMPTLKLECFLDGMTGLSRINFEALADKFDFSRYNSLCDVGGATGLLCIEVAKKHPRIECISFDLPAVEPVAKKHIAAAGLADRLRTATGDFFQDPLPKADVITMGMILHDWNLEKKMKLIRAVYDALPLGGAFIAVEALIDNARRGNVFGLLMSLNMLIEFGDAFDYSAADFEKWCREVGFQRFEVIHLAGPSSAAIAYKYDCYNSRQSQTESETDIDRAGPDASGQAEGAAPTGVVALRAKRAL